MAQDWLSEDLDIRSGRLWVAGHRGMVGRALCAHLSALGCDVITAPDALDLRDQAQTREWMAREKPDFIILAAARVGGIAANAAQPADFLYDNLMIAANVIHAAGELGTRKLVYLGSSCIYPKDAAKPIAPDALLTGALEPTNESYALAKIAGIKLCTAYRAQKGCDFISVMPCNLYGPHDRFDALGSHVIPALMLRAHEAKLTGAKSLAIWGTGRPSREFLHVDDAARGIILAMKRYNGSVPLNLGSGQEITIADLAREICAAVGYDGALAFDASKPDGVMRKVMDSSLIHAQGWAPQISLADGLRETYQWFLERREGIRNAA